LTGVPVPNVLATTNATLKSLWMWVSKEAPWKHRYQCGGPSLIHAESWGCAACLNGRLPRSA
jgi:hypothetical protein